MVITLLCLIAAVIVIYFSWNYFNERKSRPIWPIEKDIRYYELKAKYEFLVATGSLFTIVLIFMGLNTQKDLEIKLRNEYKGLLDSAAYLKKDVEIKLENSRQTIGVLTDNLAELNRTQENIAQKSTTSLSTFNSLNNQYNQLKNRPILSKDFFIIKEISYNEAPEGNRYYFQDIQTIDGKKLPEFKHPPTVLINGSTGGTFGIIRVTTEFVHLINTGGVQIQSDPPTFPLKFKLVLFEN